jgi:KaiC/GvpD/RAD55 family RecA-like ATPase
MSNPVMGNNSKLHNNKYLVEQMVEKLQTKRTESTGQARAINDSMTNYTQLLDRPSNKLNNLLENTT